MDMPDNNTNHDLPQEQQSGYLNDAMPGHMIAIAGLLHYHQLRESELLKGLEKLIGFMVKQAGEALSRLEEGDVVPMITAEDLLAWQKLRAFAFRSRNMSVDNLRTDFLGACEHVAMVRSWKEKCGEDMSLGKIFPEDGWS